MGDYYVHKARADLGSTLGPDAWALGYTNIGRMRSITEALPNGADKFVTVDEVNDFVQSKPLDWRYVWSPWENDAHLLIDASAFSVGWHIGR